MVACVVIPDISHSRNTALTGATAPLLLIAKFQNFRYLIVDKWKLKTFISIEVSNCSLMQCRLQMLLRLAARFEVWRCCGGTGHKALKHT